MTCGTCGGTEFVTVTGPAREVFGERRCANFFTHHVRRPRLDRRRVFTATDPNGVTVSFVDWEPAWQMFSEMVRRTSLRGVFILDEQLPLGSARQIASAFLP